MDGTLTQLNFETLATVFQREKTVPSIVQSMSKEEIERLGVTAIGDRVRLRELCKEDEENNSSSSFGSLSVGSASRRSSRSRTGDVPLADAVLEERRRLFNLRGPQLQSKR